jgi:hypothetical protein
MVQYSPPPVNLDRLNPIQRYMQKGSLDTRDYIYLAIFVLLYLAARPAIKKGAEWWLAPKDYREGQQAQKELLQARARAKIGANAIRDGKERPQELNEDTGTEVQASGVDSQQTGQVQHRKTKQLDLSKSEADKLLDWDDEPARPKQEGDKSDVVTWLNKWDE